MTTATELVKKYGSIRKAARATGISQRTLENRHAREARAVPSLPKTLDDWRRVTDRLSRAEHKLREALRTLGNKWVTEIELCRMTHVPVNDIVASRERFADHVVLCTNGRYAWAGTPQMAKQMRAMLDETENAD